MRKTWKRGERAPPQKSRDAPARTTITGGAPTKSRAVRSKYESAVLEWCHHAGRAAMTTMISSAAVPVDVPASSDDELAELDVVSSPPSPLPSPSLLLLLATVAISTSRISKSGSPLPG